LLSAVLSSNAPDGPANVYAKRRDAIYHDGLAAPTSIYHDGLAATIAASPHVSNDTGITCDLSGASSGRLITSYELGLSDLSAPSSWGGATSGATKNYITSQHRIEGRLIAHFTGTSSCGSSAEASIVDYRQSDFRGAAAGTTPVADDDSSAAAGTTYVADAYAPAAAGTTHVADGYTSTTPLADAWTTGYYF